MKTLKNIILLLTNIMLWSMKKLKYMTVIVVVSLVVSCEKGSHNGNGNKPIESDVIIKMWETLDSVKRTFQFQCYTEKIYPCVNYSIKSSLHKDSDGILIEFNEIHVPKICLTAKGPATANFEFEALSEGSYHLVIQGRRRFFRSIGKLIVNEDYYKIDFEKQNRLQLEYPRLNRVPENTIWGRVIYYDSTNEPLVNSFIDSLKSIGATSETYIEGEYGYFQIDSDGNIIPPQNEGRYYEKHYIYNYKENISDLKEILKHYGQQYNDLLRIELNTDKGERLTSRID